MIREITCEIENESVHIQIGEEHHRFSFDEADQLYALLADSFFEGEEEVVLMGIKMNGEEACRLGEVMEEVKRHLHAISKFKGEQVYNLSRPH